MYSAPSGERGLYCYGRVGALTLTNAVLVLVDVLNH